MPLSHHDSQANGAATAAGRGWVSCPTCSRRARKGQNFCEFCGGALRQEAAVGEEAPAEARRSHGCERCGAVVLVPEGERTATCAFCGTPYVRAGEVRPGRFAPEFVLPFSVVERDAGNAYRAWLRSGGWFRAGDLSRRGKLSALRGVYIPFWSFSMRSESTWRASIGEDWWETITETYTTTENGKTVTRTRTRRVRHTEWYPLSGGFHQYHSHYLVAASRGLPQEFADRIAPFPVEEASRYAPHFLSGWLCEEYTLEKEEAGKVSMAEFRQRERKDIAEFLPGDRHRGLEVSTTFHDTTEDLLLLPVWIFAYLYKGRTYRFVLNGATGRYWGRKPISWTRVALFAAALVVLVVWLFMRSGRGW